LDLFPEIPEIDLAARIKRRIEAGPEKTVEFSFVGLVHKRLIPVILKEAGIEDHQGRCGDLSDDQVRRIAAKLKGWEMRAVGTQSWMESQVTAGGVCTGEVNPETMESRLAAGVYFTGEVLDVDGDSGGYNLQWAWSSGYVAGTRAAG
jgi:hypothetical protein